MGCPLHMTKNYHEAVSALQHNPRFMFQAVQKHVNFAADMSNHRHGMTCLVCVAAHIETSMQTDNQRLYCEQTNCTAKKAAGTKLFNEETLSQHDVTLAAHEPRSMLYTKLALLDL